MHAHTHTHSLSLSLSPFSPPPQAAAAIAARAADEAGVAPGVLTSTGGAVEEVKDFACPAAPAVAALDAAAHDPERAPPARACGTAQTPPAAGGGATTLEEAKQVTARAAALMEVVGREE